MNGTEATQHYKLSVSGLKGIAIEAKDNKHSKINNDNHHMNDSEERNHVSEDENDNQTIMIKPAESRWVIVDLKIPDGSVESGSHKIEFEVEAVESKQTVKEDSIFLVPMQ
jgi:hypothetical protein